MATVSQTERWQLQQLLAQLGHALTSAKRQLPWAEGLIRADLEALQVAIIDMDRGFGPNLGRIPGLLHQDRFRYLSFLDPRQKDKPVERMRAGVRNHQDVGLAQAA